MSGLPFFRAFCGSPSTEIIDKLKTVLDKIIVGDDFG